MCIVGTHAFCANSKGQNGPSSNLFLVVWCNTVLLAKNMTNESRIFLSFLLLFLFHLQKLKA